jgi:hypothetical protein
MFAWQVLSQKVFGAFWSLRLDLYERMRSLYDAAD